jgi:osmotically-inducible protein OsmY
MLSPGFATAAYDQSNQPQYQDQSQSYNTAGSQNPGQFRNMRLEQQIAGQLRQQGYGTQGEIMILATGNRVILLGTVPDQRTKNGAENIAKQTSSGARVDNRLHVNAQAKRLPDAELEKDTYDNLGGDLSQSVQVRAQNGMVALQGQLDNWNQVADAIDAAFKAGASQVNSQFSVAGAGAMAQGGAGGYSPPSGYAPSQQAYPPSGAPGFQGQAAPGAMGGQTYMGGPTQATSTDVRLARQVASQLRQQLPPGQNVQLVQPQSIYVTVQRGTVILHGYVQNSSQKQQAQQIAQSIQGVQNVRNDLAILGTQGAPSQGYGGTTGQYGTPSGAPGSGGTTTAPGPGGTSGQSMGGASNQSGSYQPQGYIPSQSNQSQPGMSSQDQYGQSSMQPSSGGTTDQSQYGPSSTMGGQQMPMSASDMALAQRVVQQLKQQLAGIQNIQLMRPGTIYVMAVQGNVMLHGTITNPNVKQQADQIANAVPGVRNVTDTLRVIGAAAGGYPSYGYIPGQGQTTPSQGNAGQGTSNQNQGTSNQSQNMQRFIADTGQMATSQSDMALAQQVAQRLRQQLSGIQNVQIARPGTIYVIVNKGTVTLDGFVPDSNSKMQAEQIAKSISGVTNVKNSLNIGGAATGGNAPLGYMPPNENQFANPQLGNQMPGNQVPGNQIPGNQPFSGQTPENQQFGNQQPDEDQSADQPSDEGAY